MTLLIPYGLNSALRPQPRRDAGADDAWAKLGKAAERAKASEPSHSERSAAIGKMLMSGELRAGTGLSGKDALAKRASGRRFPITTDRPNRDWLDQQVADYLRHAPGVSPVNGRVFGAFGAGPRMVKATGDSNLAGTAGKPLSDDALDGLNQLSTGLRQSVVAALTQPVAPDKYAWRQWVMELRDKINAECEAMGIDPAALLRAFNQRNAFFDPMVQEHPAQPPAGARALGPVGSEDPLNWPAELNPPATPRSTGSFSNTINGQKFAKFSNTARGRQLRKFYDYGRAGPPDVQKREDGSPAELEAYAKVVVRSEIGGALKNQILQMHDARKRMSKAAWSAVKREGAYRGLVNAILGMKTLTQPMEGACLALIN